MAIYLDNNATTSMHPDVLDTMHAWYRDQVGNPASQHQLGARARRALEDAREAIASMLGADLSGTHGDRLVLTSGGTESNNLAIFGIASDQDGPIFVSPIEHPSVLGPVDELERRGKTILRLTARPDGVVDIGSAERLYLEFQSSNGGSAASSRPSLLCLMLGNHETGVLQPVAAMAEWAARQPIAVHCDAVQVVGKLPVDFRRLAVSSLSFAAHKFHGPCGIGGLLLRHDVRLRPLFMGGFQQQGTRPGTEAVGLVLGMRRALEIGVSEQQRRDQQLRALRDRFESLMMHELPDCHVHGAAAERLPHVSNISFPDVDRQALVMALDVAGIAVSTGSACESGSSSPSPVLQAMGVSRTHWNSSIRISLSYQNTESEVVQTARHIVQLVNNLRKRTITRKVPLAARQASTKPL